MTNDYYQPINTSAQNPLADDQQAKSDDLASNDSASVQKEADLLVDKLSENIARDLGFDDAPQEQKKKILDGINQRVETAVLKAILANCPPETARELGEKIVNETITPEEIEKVIKDNPELQGKIEDEVGALYEKMLAESEQVWAGVSQEPDASKQDAEVSKPVKTQASEAGESQANQNPAETSLSDKIKSAGIPIEHTTVAQKIYEMRSNGEISADLNLTEVPEVERARRLSEWDWNKAGEVVEQLKNNQ